MLPIFRYELFGCFWISSMVVSKRENAAHFSLRTFGCFRLRKFGGSKLARMLPIFPYESFDAS